MAQILGTSPIIGLTFKVYKLFSYLQPTSYIRFSIIPLCVMNVFQFMALYGNDDEIGQVIINAYLTILFFNAAVRTNLVLE